MQGGRREEGSGWGTRVYLWQIHVDIWQNQYNIVKLKNKIKLKKNTVACRNILLESCLFGICVLMTVAYNIHLSCFFFLTFNSIQFELEQFNSGIEHTHPEVKAES